MILLKISWMHLFHKSTRVTWSPASVVLQVVDALPEASYKSPRRQVEGTSPPQAEPGEVDQHIQVVVDQHIQGAADTWRFSASKLVVYYAVDWFFPPMFFSVEFSTSGSASILCAKWTTSLIDTGVNMNIIMRPSHFYSAQWLEFSWLFVNQSWIFIRYGKSIRLFVKQCSHWLTYC